MVDEHLLHGGPGALDHPSDLTETMVLGGEAANLPLQL